MTADPDGSSTDFVTFRNLVVVPSIHYTPEFGQQVRRLFDEINPDAVAVELPESLQPSFEAALEALPRLQGLWEPAGEDRGRLLPLVPTDSIVEAARQARERGRPLYCVDCESRGKYDDRPLQLPDPILLEKISPFDYHDLAGPVAGELTAGEENERREAHMAAHLVELIKTHSRVVFVCGMLHWERIKSRIQDGNVNYADHASRSARYERVNLDPSYLEWELGLIPYDVYLYERNRRHGKPYSRSENIGGLYREATRVHGYRQSPRLQRQMIQYARNLSLKGHRCSPGLYQVVLSAKSMEDDRYARDVLETARSYPFYQPDESLQTLSGNEKGAEKDGKTVEITLQVPNEDSLRRIGPLEQLNFRTGRRENPYKDQAPDGSYSRQWGRYEDEMVREERFLKRLETIACQQSGSERESRPFSGGLMDGLDVGRTLRFLHEDRIYVRKRPPEPEPYDAIIVDYASLEGKPVTWAGGCYTYGYHKGFGWQSRATKTGEGIGRARWHYLCSYKRAFEGDQHVIESTDRMLERRADGETIAEAFFTTAINRAPGNRILYVGATVPRILNHYRSTQRIDTLGFARLDESLLRKLQSFNLYYYPRSKTP